MNKKTKENLIENLRNYGFSENILKAFEKVPREDFLSENFRSRAYEDTALPINSGQTISQPYTIAFMLDLLEISEKNKKYKILEVGSGSGYVLALISEIVKNSEVYGVEIVKNLVESSREQLRDKKNIEIFQAKKGVLGLPRESEKEKFDRILVSAAGKKIPSEFIKQLKIGGILVIPVRNSIIKLMKFADENKIEEYRGFAFAPLIE